MGPPTSPNPILVSGGVGVPPPLPSGWTPGLHSYWVTNNFSACGFFSRDAHALREWLHCRTFFKLSSMFETREGEKCPRLISRMGILSKPVRTGRGKKLKTEYGSRCFDFFKHFCLRCLFGREHNYSCLPWTTFTSAQVGERPGPTSHWGRVSM